MSQWTIEREAAALARRNESHFCHAAWWITGAPWGDELSIHAGPGEDPHWAILTVCSFDTMSEQCRSGFDELDSSDIDEIGREVLRCIVADHRDLPDAIEEITCLREALRSERRMTAMKTAELKALVDRLRWRNHNGRMAYVLKGVGYGEIWALLSEVRKEIWDKDQA